MKRILLSLWFAATLTAAVLALGTGGAVFAQGGNDAITGDDFTNVVPTTASLGDFVWHDLDQDGIQDPGEPGMEGVTVELYNNGICAGDPMSTTVTDGDGHYLFPELAPGPYSLRFVRPAGYDFSPTDQGNDDAVDSDGAQPRTPPVVDGLYSGDEGHYAELAQSDDERGVLYFSRVGDTLYLLMRVDPDVNDNVFGKRNTDDAYVQGAGWNRHTFKDLLNSDHMEFDLSCGDNNWTWSQDYLYDADGDKDPHEADWLSDPYGNDGDGTPPPGLVSASSLQWNMNHTLWDVTLNGSRTNDKDYKSPDPMLDYPGYDSAHRWEWALIYEMSMDVSACGSDDIAVEVVSAHNSPSKDDDEDVSVDATIVPDLPDACTGPIYLVEDLDDMTWDAGFYPQTISLSGRVWHDQYFDEGHKVDGIQDDGEPAIANVLVELYDSSDNLVATTTTDANGAYEFTDLTPGVYRVKVADSNFQAGGAMDESDDAVDWHASPQDVGGDDAVDSDGDESTHDVQVTLAPGEDKQHVDFGFFQACVQLTKTGPDSVSPGETFDFHFAVYNCGDIVLHGGVTVYDPLLNPSGDHEIWNEVVYPGETKTFDESYTISEDECPSLTNEASAEGHPKHPYGYYLDNVSDEDSWTVTCSAWDWGDAPNTYKTDRASGGPRHQLGSGLVIGSVVDDEFDGQPSSAANGDDNAGTDDEDAFASPIMLTAGQPAQIAVPVHNPLSSDATLYGWVDFNQDGDFNDAGESASATAPAGVNGPITLDFGVTPSSAFGATFARFRLTTDALCTAGEGGTYRDEFNSVAFNNSDGSKDWSGHPWQEIDDDDDPADGDIRITNGRLRFKKLDEDAGIERQADLSNASQAILTFDWETEDLEENIKVYISSDGTNFDLLGEISGEWESGSASYDISNYASANTTIRFINTDDDWSSNDDILYIDNVQIEVDTACVGGPASDGEVEDHPVIIEQPTYALGDYVWNDADADGVQDADETGINGVLVDLYAGACDSLTPSSTPLQSTTTSSHNGVDGWYEFAGLNAGPYCVVLSSDNYEPGGALVGFIASPANASGDPATDSNGSPSHRADVTLAGDDLTIDFGLYQAPPIEAGACYVIADNGDFFGRIDINTGLVQVIGAVNPPDGENLAVQPSDLTLFNVAGNNAATPLITIDDQNAATTIINGDIGLNDVDALTFDPTTEILYAVAVSPRPGALYQVDPATGSVTHLVDLQVPSPDPLAGEPDPHIDGAAIDPNSGTMYGIYTAWAGKSYLVTINKTTGELTLVGGPQNDPGYTGVDDIEDIAFHPNGQLYGTLGDVGALGNDPSGSYEGLVRIDLVTAAATPVGLFGDPLPGYASWDMEALACANPPNAASLGDYVWWDQDEDGVQDADEPGLAGVSVTLKDGGGNTVASTTTDANGAYSFDTLVPGDYQVVFTLPNADWSFSPQDQGGDDALDSDADPTTGASPIITLAAGEDNDTVDAGVIIPASFTITKENTTAETDIAPTDPVSFTITIENTGSAIMTVVPLRDIYNTTYLHFTGASIAPDDTIDDGQIDWSDLTVSFGRDLAPGDSFTIIVNFTARAATDPEPDHVTINTAVVHDDWADPDGASGPAPAIVLPDQSDDASVQIVNPVAEELIDFSALTAGNAVRLRWTTASESNILGFNILRQNEGEAAFTQVNDAIIFARQAGADVGAAYDFVDRRRAEGATLYALEIIHLDGSVERYYQRVSLPPSGF